jgi:hypothetical protein
VKITDRWSVYVKRLNSGTPQATGHKIHRPSRKKQKMPVIIATRSLTGPGAVGQAQAATDALGPKAGGIELTIQALPSRRAA